MSQPILLPVFLYGEIGTLILLVGVVAIWGCWTLGLTRGQALILSLVASLFLIAVGVCVVTHG